MVIFALGATVFLGFLALATDLSLQTSERRTVQNVADGAALAGAYELKDFTDATFQQERTNAVTEAVKVIHKNYPWSTGVANYASQIVSSAGTCPSTGSACDLTYTLPAPYQHISVTIDTPPANGQFPVIAGQYAGEQMYLQVVIQDATSNQLGAFVGQGTGHESAQAIAHHIAPNTPFGFALYTKTYAVDGNASELVQGNVYAYRHIYPQSNGQADFCATGAIVLGYPQYPNPYPSPDPAAGQVFQHSLVHGNTLTQAVADCSNISGGGTVAEAQTLNTCPTSVQGVDLTGIGTPDTQYTHACVVDPAIQPPALVGPTIPSYGAAQTYGCGQGLDATTQTYQPGIYSCSTGPALRVDHPLQQGVYKILGNGSGGDVQVTTSLNNCSSYGLTYNVCLIGVTFDLENSAGINVGIQSGQIAITPYVPSSPQSINDGKFPIFAPPSSVATLSSSTPFTTLFLTGTLYMPDGNANFSANGTHISINGQAIVGTWTVQSGNHSNPDITYNPGRVAAEREVLELVS